MSKEHLKNINEQRTLVHETNSKKESELIDEHISDLTELEINGIEDNEALYNGNNEMDGLYLKDTIKIMNNRESWLFNICPEGLKEYYEFRIKISKMLRNKYSIGNKITDYFS